MSTLTSTQLQQQYIAYFGRPGDPAGIKYWLSSGSGISSAREFAEKIYAQDEYKTATVGSKSTEEQVNSLYVNLFGRQADSTGLLYWTNEIEKGNLVLANVATDLIWAASNPSSGNSAQATLDAQALDNKVKAAEAYTAEVEASTTAILAYQAESTSPWKTGSAFSSAKTYLAGIDSSTAHSASGISTTVVSMTTGSNASSGTNFTLTNSANQTTGGADNFTGTTGDDTFLALSDAALDNGDVVDGGAGTDTLTARYSISSAKTLNTSVKNVEVFKVDFDDGAVTSESLTVNVDGFTGLTDVVAVDGDDSGTRATDYSTLNFTKIAAGVNLGITRGDASLIYDFDYATITGLTDTATLKLDTAKARNVIVAGIETVTVDTTGKSTLSELNIAAAKKLILTGSGDLTVTDLDAGTNTVLKTVDGSAATGKINLTSFIAGDITVTGGSGNDTFDVTANGIGVKDTIAGGDGTDRLKVASAMTTALPLVTSIETLEIQSDNADALDSSATGTANITVDTSVISTVNNVVIDLDTGEAADSGTITVSKLDSGDTVTIDQMPSDTSGGVALTGTLASDTSTDVINLVVNGLGAPTTSAADATGADVLTFATVETINVTSNNNSDASVTATTVEELSGAVASSINVSGAADLTLTELTNTTKLTTFDASALTGKLTVGGAATGFDKSDLTFTAGSGDTVVTVLSLNNADTIKGGASAKDVLTAPALGSLTATTGKFNVSGFETIELNVSDTVKNTFDLSLVSGADVVQISSEATVPGAQTINNVPAGTKISFGDLADELDGNVDVTITLADSTGASDHLETQLDNRGGGASDFDIITAADIEKLTIDVLETTSTSTGDSTISLDKAKAATLVLKGGVAGDTLTLGTLANETVTIDTTALKADATIAVGTTATGITWNAGALAADDAWTLSAKDDTITIAATGAVDVDVDGGAGTDVMNLTVKTGFIDAGEIDNFETLNLTISPGDDITIGATDTEENGLNDTKTVNILGGNSQSTLTAGVLSAGLLDSTTTKTYDASGFDGNISLVFDKDKLLDTATITGGALGTDVVKGLYDASGNTYTHVTSGVETFIIDADVDEDDDAKTYTFDISKMTGLKTIKLNTETTQGNNDAPDVVINKYTDAVTIQLGETTVANQLIYGVNGSSKIDVNLDSTAGTTDKLKLHLLNTGTDDKSAGSIDNGSQDIGAAGVEIVDITLNSSDTASLQEDHNLDLTDVAPTTNSFQTINISGGISGELLTIDAVSTKTNVIEASEIIHALTLTDRPSIAMTIDTGDGNDSIKMEHKSDAINSGAGTDTLVVGKAAILGGISVDLSATGDQITTFNGAANAAIQKGFENVDLSGYTGNYGADITAVKTGSTITGTKQADVITLNTAAITDTIHFDTGGTSADQITNFLVGTAATADIVNLDISEMESAGALFSGVTLNFEILNTTASITASTTLAAVSRAASTTAGATDKHIWHLDGNSYANVGAAVDSIEASGANELQHTGTKAAGDAFLMLYETGTATRLAAVYYVASDANTTSTTGTTAGNLNGIDLIEWTDITDGTTVLGNSNIDLV